jgi:hypothetical protein
MATTDQATPVVDGGLTTDGQPSDHPTATDNGWHPPLSTTEGQPAATPDDPQGLDRHAGRIISTGELRARLQRIVPLRLRGPVMGLDGRFHFDDGELVVSQYWGSGAVMLTPVRLEAGPPIMAVAHDVRAELY